MLKKFFQNVGILWLELKEKITIPELIISKIDESEFFQVIFYGMHFHTIEHAGSQAAFEDERIKQIENEWRQGRKRKMRMCVVQIVLTQWCG